MFFSFISFYSDFNLPQDGFAGLADGTAQCGYGLGCIEVKDRHEVYVFIPQFRVHPAPGQDGVGGAEVAANIAKGKGGVTLESTIETKGITMPEWDFNNPSSMDAWDMASAAYAEQVSGEVRAVVGTKLRSDNTWENVELPRLMGNSNVTKITIIDPKTGIETVIFER